jgi:hypothetical protein
MTRTGMPNILTFGPRDKFVEYLRAVRVAHLLRFARGGGDAIDVDFFEPRTGFPKF